MIRTITTVMLASLALCTAANSRAQARADTPKSDGLVRIATISAPEDVMKPRSIEECTQSFPKRGFCFYTQPNHVNMQDYSFHELSESFHVPYVVFPIKSLVKNHYTPKLKIFSQPNFNGKCRLLNDGKNSPWIWMMGQLPFDVHSMKAVPGTQVPTAACPSA